MFVLNDYRSKGIGKMLTQEFIKWCKSRKVEKVRAVASARNEKAIKFYHREEFEDYELVFERDI